MLAAYYSCSRLMRIDPVDALVMRLIAGVVEKALKAAQYKMPTVAVATACPGPVGARV